MYTRRFPCRRQRLHFVDQQKDERVGILQKLFDDFEHLHDQFPTLRKPLGKERVGIDLHQLARGIPTRTPDGQLLRQGFAERGFAGARWAVQQDHAIAGD